MRRKMRNLTLGNDPGLSWIEDKNNIHAFKSGDQLHPQVYYAEAVLHREDDMEEAGVEDGVLKRDNPPPKEAADGKKRKRWHFKRLLCLNEGTAAEAL
ncbi:hypothetical protein V6N11_041007 [Hibiscus sabdariffa]|uniref:Uncharacterized protein n=1 Tax=Hibiscus sabdariffa TaxID=183260 RepID=A0ABR2RJD0_9ROSI